jgi:hypothetical protein
MGLMKHGVDINRTLEISGILVIYQRPTMKLSLDMHRRLNLFAAVSVPNVFKYTSHVMFETSRASTLTFIS